MKGVSTIPSQDDVEWANQFVALHNLLELCDRSEDAALLLSTCRNAYLTINALFADLCVLLGDGKDARVDLRGGAELLIQGAEPIKLLERFRRTTATVREFEGKRDVWRNRANIDRDIEEALDKLDKTHHLPALALRRTLGHARASDDSYTNGEARAFLERNLAELPHLNPFFVGLDQCFAVLSACSALGLKVAEIQVAALAGSQLNLLAPENSVEPQGATSIRVADLMIALADACNWSVKSSTTVVISRDYRRPSHTALADSVDIPGSDDCAALTAASEQLGGFMREALYYVHDRLGKVFQPNIGVAPMPTPFEIRLPLPVPDRVDGEFKGIKLETVRCSCDESVPNSPSIAIAHLAVTVKNVNLSSYKFDSQDVSDKISHDVRHAVHLAHEEGCKAIVFPEYSIPSKMSTELLTLSNELGLIVIGGLEGEFRHGRLCDPVAVAIPKESSVHYQCKQEPSQEEVASFFVDNKLHVFLNTCIGHFSVIVCSDFLELATLLAWKSDEILPDVLFVVARNTHDQLYIDFAKTDSFRLYTCVVIANVKDEHDGTASNAGSCVVTPLREERMARGRDIPVTGTTFLQKLSIHELPIHAIRARSNGKPMPGFYAVPKSARRT